MTQNEKDLLLKDLCARLQYGVKLSDDDGNTINVVGIHKDTIIIPYAGITRTIRIDSCKPYLFPLSSMTEEQRKEYDSIIYHSVELHWQRYYEVIDVDSFEELQDFYHKNHLDYRGLIPMGLANDATGLNIY